MSVYKFEVVIDNVATEVSPVNWRDIELSYDFDFRQAKYGDIPALEFCDKSLLDTLEALDICKEVTFLISEGDGKAINGIYYQGSVRLSEIEKDCDNEGVFTVPVLRESTLEALNKNGKEKICYLTDTNLQLFQIESGGFYTDDNDDPLEFPFISLIDLSTRIYKANGGIGTIGTTGGDTDFTTGYAPGNNNYQAAYSVIRPDALPSAGVDIQITIEGEFGQDYNITVTTPAGGWTDGREMLETIQNGLLYYIGHGAITLNMRAYEMYSRIAYIEVLDTGSTLGPSMEIYSYWDQTEIKVYIGGVESTTWIVDADINPQRFSNGEDLYISGKGLTNQVCIGWDELADIALKTQGAYASEYDVGESVQFISNAGHDVDITLTPGLDDPFTDAFNVKKSYDTEFIVKQVEAGYSFRLSDYEKDRDDMVFLPTTVIPDKFRVTPPVSDLTYIVLRNSCIATFTGNIVLTNVNPSSSENYTLTLKVNGIDQDSTSGSIPPNGAEVTIPLVPGFPLLGSYEFASGDEIEFYLSSAGPNVSAVQGKSDWRIDCEVCFERPFLDEDEANTHVTNFLDDFKTCRGSRNEQLEGVYAGSGFAFYQQVEEKQNYSNAFFMTYKEIGANRARRFEHQVYFQSGDPFICDHLKGEKLSFFTYNAPIQLPRMIINVKNRVPSSINVPQYSFVNTVSGTGVYSTTVSFVEGNISQDVKRPEILSFDVCGDLLSIYHPYYNRNKISIEDICGETQQSICKSIRYNLSTGVVSIETRV